MVYVSSNASGVYLSESDLKDLALIDDDFPNSTIRSAAATMNVDEECSCMPRSHTPEKPETILFVPTKENKGKLRDWLVSAFKSSAFNTCSHQPLKEMTGPPMHIKFKDNAEPHAVHRPIQVPVHWIDKVKEDLDRDVRLVL